MSELVIASGKYRGKKIVIPQSGLVIGRDRGCQMRISSDQISRVHCKFTVSQDGIILKDLGSRNGTFVNENRIENDRQLKSGDVVKVGPLTLEIREKRSEVSNMSDDDIASWLNDDTADGKLTDDSTLVPEMGITDAEIPTASEDHKPKKKFRSLGEEAADIIRRHWELDAAKKASNENSPAAS